MPWDKSKNKTSTGEKRKGRNEVDKDTVEALALRGFNRNEIADKTGISQHTASKIITEVNATKTLLADYRTKRADTFTLLHLKSVENISDTLEIINNAVASHKSGEEIMKPKDMADLLKAQAMLFDRVHYQERLEEGKSTANVSNYWSQVVQSGDKGRKATYKTFSLEKETGCTTVKGTIAK